MNRRERDFALLVTSAAAIAGVLVMLRHEWWRDEANTWLVVRTSRSMGELVKTIGFNGHPKAYYLLCWVLSRIFSSPLSLATVNLACAIAAIFLFVRYSPFSRLERALFAFGFFPLYQYGIIVRSYAAFVLLLFAYAALRLRAPERRATRFLVLAALAEVHLMATLAAAVLFLLDVATTTPRTWKKTEWGSAALVALSGAAVVWQLEPRDRHYQSMTFSPAIRRAIAGGFLPVFSRYEPNLWERNVGTALFVAAAVIAVRHRAARAPFLFLTATMLVFNRFVYPGYRWHDGFYFLYFVVALWLGGVVLTGASRAFVTALFALHAAIGIDVLARDFREPYSNGAAVASAIRACKLEHLAIVGVRGSRRAFSWDIDEIQPVLLELNPGLAYDPQARSLEPFWRHYDDPNYFPTLPMSRLVPALRQIEKELGSPFLVVEVLSKPDGRPALPPLLKPIFEAPPSMDFGEHLALFSFGSEASSTACR